MAGFSGGDDLDFVVRKSSRKKKANVKQRLLDDSEGSDDDFVSLSKRSKPCPDKRAEDVCNQKTTLTSNQKSNRLSRDEKLFNRDLEQAIAVSTSTSQEQPSASSSPGAQTTSDTSDYSPAHDQHLSDSDADFEPSPVTKTIRKSTSNKKKPSSKKENVKTASNKVTRQPKPAVTAPKLPACVNAVKCMDLPGTKASLSPTAAGGRPKTGVKARWVPPSRVQQGSGSGGSSHTRTTAASGIRVGLSRRAPIKPLHQLQTKNN